MAELLQGTAGGWLISPQFEFTSGGGWSILEVRENEENAPRFRRSGKTVGGVCVFGGLDAAVGAGLGIGFAGCGDGLLRWSDVPLARAWAEEKFERFRPREGCADGQLRTPCAQGGDGLQLGVLPSEGSLCGRDDCFRSASCCGDFCTALNRPTYAWPFFFDELPSF